MNMMNALLGQLPIIFHNQMREHQVAKKRSGSNMQWVCTRPGHVKIVDMPACLNL